jgi:acylphosphatase
VDGTIQLTSLNTAGGGNYRNVWLAFASLEAVSVSGTPPTADDKAVNVTEDGSVNITLSGTDPEGSNLTYHVVSMPANGTLTTNGALPEVTYTPDANYFGSDSFTYYVNDGALDSAMATVSITVDSGNNDVPVADDKEVSVLENGSVEITLSGSDAEGSILTYNVSQPANGTVTTNGALPDVIYTPDANFFGADSFTYTVNDGEQDSAPATVTITVNQQANGGELSMNGDFETNDGAVTGNNKMSALANWVGYLDGESPKIRCDLGDGITNPDSGSVMPRLISNATTGDRGLYQDFSPAWDSESEFTISFNASEVSWKAGGTDNDGVTVSLGDQDEGNAASVYLNLDGSYDVANEPYVSWTSNQTHELTITGAELIAAGVTVGEGLRIDFASHYTGTGNSIIWVDNVSVFLPLAPTTVGDISIEVVSGGTEVALTWVTEAGWNYGVAVKDDLVYGTWSNIITGVEGVDGEVTVTNSVPADAKFFRAYLDN